MIQQRAPRQQARYPEQAHAIPESGPLGGEWCIPVHAPGDEEEYEGAVEEYGAVRDEGERGPGVAVVDRR